MKSIRHAGTRCRSPVKKAGDPAAIKRSRAPGWLNAIPVLPFISDTDEELEKIITASKAHGAEYILVGGLTLFGKEAADSKTLYYKFLERYDPELVTKYKSLYRIYPFPPKQYQKNWKERAAAICKKYNIRTSICWNDIKLNRKDNEDAKTERTWYCLAPQRLCGNLLTPKVL